MLRVRKLSLDLGEAIKHFISLIMCRLSNLQPRMLHRASNAGEQTTDILSDAGISRDDIMKYIDAGVVEQYKE